LSCAEYLHCWALADNRLRGAVQRHPEHNWLTANGLAYCLAPIGLDKMGFNAEKGARVGLVHCPPNDFQGVHLYPCRVPAVFACRKSSRMPVV
jgi:hypothetical protein